MQTFAPAGARIGARPALQGPARLRPALTGVFGKHAARLGPCAAVRVADDGPSLQELLQSSMQQASMQQATMPANEEPKASLSPASLPSTAPQQPTIAETAVQTPVVSQQPAPAIADAAVDVPAESLAAAATQPSAASPVFDGASSGAVDSSSVSAPSQLSDAASQAQQSAEALASGAVSKASELTDAASAATSQAAEAASKAASDLSSAVSGAASGISGAVSGVGDAVSGAASSVSAGVSGLVGRAASLFSQVKGSVDQAVGGVTSTVSSSLEGVTSTTGAATSAVSSSVGDAIASARAATDAAASAVESRVGGAVVAANEAASSAIDALPQPAKEAVLAVGGAVGAVAGQAAAHPRVALALTAAVAVPAGVSWYHARYGGYAGDLQPEQVLDLLMQQNAALIDIRSDDERSEEGVVEVKLAARAKVAAFPLQVSIPSRIAREASNAEELRLLVNAAYITGLPQVPSAVTKVVIMDSSGSGAARKVARALASVGQPLAYIMMGGFEGWVEAGLPTRDSSSYVAGPAAVIGDELEVLAGSVGSALDNLKQPSVGVPVVGGAVLSAVAIYNYHTTLEYIGLLGLLATATKKASQYSSPREALDDAVGAYQRLVSKLPMGRGRQALGEGNGNGVAGSQGNGEEQWERSGESSGTELEAVEK